MSRAKKSKRTYSDEIKETARARVAAGESLSKVAREIGVAKSTLSSWLTQADRDGHQEVRENQKQRFIRQAWETVFKAVTVGDKRLGFVLENADTLDQAVKAVTSSDLCNTDKTQILKVLASLANVPLKDLAIYIGTVYDKIALASGDVTTRGEVKGQVTQRYEYDITQKIITDPETAKLADQLLQRAANSDAGMVRAHNKPWSLASIRPLAAPEPEDT